MIKKILLPIFIIFTSIFAQGQITLTTTSSSGTWSPAAVTNTGNILTWAAADNTASGGTFNGQTENANNPIFDFSSNNGTPIVITITNTGNDFSGLTTLSFNGDLESGDISGIDIVNATSLIDFGINYNNLSTLNLTQNVVLEALNIRGNQQLYDQTLDVSNNLNLRVIIADNSGINALDVSANAQINDVRLYGARLTSEVMDQLLIDLDNHGLSNGNIEIKSQKGGDVLTYQSKIAYLSLISKGWTIDVSEPPAEDIKTITLITNTSSSGWRLDRVYNYGAMLHWEATNTLIGTIPADQYDNEIAPTFDFSANDGSPITITITSNEGFNALDQLNLNNEVGNVNSEITNVDIANAVNLGSFAPFNSSLTDVDVSNNTKLYRILIHGDVRQLVGKTLNTDNNPDINHVRIDNTGIVSVDFTNNPLLLKVWLMDASLTSTVMDNVVITLDQHGLSGGDLRFSGQTTGDQLTSASYAAYNSLIAKNWTIDVSSPPAPPKLEMTGNGNAISSGNTASTADGTDFEDVAINVALPHTFTITNSGDEDLIITAATVSGATEFTTNLTAQTIAAGISVDFEVTFLPTTTGQRGSNLLIENNDTNFTLHVEGRGIIGTGSKIDVQGGNPLVSIPGDGTNTPSITDDTDFGQTAAGTVITKTFTIQNLGDQPLDLTGNPDLVAISGTNATDFTISALPATPVAVGAVTTFEVTFNANSLGIRTATLTIESNDPNDPTYVFHIQAESTQASGPEINVTGNGISISSGNTPNVADDTDFEQVAIGSPITKIFTIENLGDSDLTINSAGLYNNTGGFSSLDIGGFPPFGGIISVGSSMTFDITFDPANAGVQTVLVGIVSDDSDEGNYVINLTAEGIPASSGTIVVEGNGQPISNGDTTPDVADDTNFGQVENNTTRTVTYTIRNTNATEDLIVNSISLPYSDSEFTVSNDPTPVTIAAGSSATFSIDFNPLTTGNYAAHVEIDQSDLSNNTFKFDIAGEGVIAQNIMITQYYDGLNSTDKWIEVKNISNQTIGAGTYYLALFDNTIARVSIIESHDPTQSTSIPELLPGQVILFKNAAASKPVNIGTANQVDSDVCTFLGGDDVILISTKNDVDCYNNRVDIIGNVSPSSGQSPNVWGNNDPYIKGACSSEIPHLNFDINDWTKLLLDDIDAANPNTNLALGTQAVGPTEYDGANWSNLEPDQSRTVVLTNSFNYSGTTVEACNLIINNGVNVVFDSNGATNNSIIVYGDFTNNGSLTIGDTESFIAYKDNAVLGEIIKIEKSKPLGDIHDATYWSSPVQSQQLYTVFTGVDINRIFEYKAGNTNPLYAGTNYRYWWKADNGAMEGGRGYSVEGSSNTPTGVQTITFSGVPFNGNISKSLYYSGTSDTGNENENFNLIGNPYPTAINITSFLQLNGNISDIALWSHQTPVDQDGNFTPADYLKYSLSGPNSPGVTNNIGSGQGFMARTISSGGGANGGANFSNALKIEDQNDQFYKSEVSKRGYILVDGNKDRIWLRLTSKSIRKKDDILIAFSKESTDDFDPRYDTQIGLGEKEIHLYSQIPDKDSKFVIQGLGDFDQNKTISVGLDSQISGSLSIGIAGLEGQLKGEEVYLADHLLNITHDIKASDYQFEQTVTGSFPNRFTLQFAGQALDVDDEIFAKNEFVISNDLDGFKIRSAKEVKDIKVFDLLGRMIIQKQPNKKSFNINTTAIKNGTVLIVKATLDNGTVVSKKTIKY